jgi:hypothetical protein
METQNFDHIVCSDRTAAEDLRRYAEALGRGVPTFSFDSPRVEEVRRVRRRDIAGPTVYVPSIMVGDSVVIGAGYFEDTWYHRWHVALLDAMSERSDVQFVWKAMPGSNQAVDPIREMIEERRLPNVTFRSDPFLRVLPHAGRVFTDYPSTAFFEAMHVGCPVLALVFSRFARVRPSAAALFEPVLRTCADEGEALAYLHAFLDDDPSASVLRGRALP